MLALFAAIAFFSAQRADYGWKPAIATPAFTASGIGAIRGWVESGGSLLLIADHAPFGESASGLAEALGVVMHRGFVEVPGEPSDPLLFAGENGRLGDHPILTGDSAGTGISRVETYTGQSLDGPTDASVLLALPAIRNVE